MLLPEAQQWKRTIHPELRSLKRWLCMRRLLRNFSNGTAQPLGQNVFYLGECQATACYVLQDEQGLVCIDPGQGRLRN